MSTSLLSLPVMNKISPTRILKSLGFLVHVPKADFLFICHDCDRSVMLCDKAYAPFLDPIRDYLAAQGYSTISYAQPGSKLTNSRAHGFAFSMNASFYFRAALTKILRYLRMTHLFSLKHSYRVLLEATSPKIVFSIGCTSQLCKAANELHICLVEALHGIGYHKDPWGWAGLDGLFLPSSILSYDKVSSNTFGYLPSKGSSVIDISLPFLDLVENSINDYPDFRVNDALLSKFPKQVLVSLQWGYAGDSINAPELNGIIVNGIMHESLILLIEERSDILFRIRMHPVHVKKRIKYNSVFDLLGNIASKYANVEFIDSSSKPLLSVASYCTAHITMSSLSAYEVAYLGVPTLALCPNLMPGMPYQDLFEDLVHDGYLVKHSPDIPFMRQWLVNSKLLPRRVFSDQSSTNWHETVDSIVANSSLLAKA